MAYQRKTRTPAELSAARSLAAKSRKKHAGGRPKGSPNKNNPAVGVPTVTMTVHQPAYQVFSKLARIKNKTNIEFMDILAENLKAKNPKIFSAKTEPTL